MVDIKKKVSELIDSENSVHEVLSLTGQVVKKAALKMKPSKADVSEGFTSDSLLHAPDSLFDLLASVYRSWLIHGTVTPSLLACAADTNSYRAIAGSSLLLKLFDQCVLLLWGHLPVIVFSLAISRCLVPCNAAGWLWRWQTTP